ncbi:MAG: OadG family transporter subunit [Candidatus Krumholzibacteria bacterium]|nr:OadG family transporter subunit [Candidatus Krumholzibacteria bacterium]
MGGSITPEMGSLAIAGVLIVFGVLALISLVVALLKKLDGRWQDHERRVDEAAVTREPTIDNTTLVLISAAAATVVQGRFRVRRIHRLLSPKRKRTPWSAQGRLILQGSHTVRRKRS